MTPFIFGKLAVSQNFTNRNKELERLVGNFSALTNTTLISPRRWGKSSLVRKAAQVAEERDKKVHVCFMDAFSVHTEEEFYQLLATEILRISASKMELLVKNAKKFLGKFIPKVSFSADGISDVSLALDWH
ncbi:MAG: ATPase, partial [Bacteroidales bacterium]